MFERAETARAGRQATRDRLAATSLARLNAPDPLTFEDDARFALDALPALTTRPDQIKQLRQTILNLAVCGKLVSQDPNDEPITVTLRKAMARRAALVRAKKVRQKKIDGYDDLDHLNQNEQRLLRLAVNRLAEKGSWDIAELDAEFKELILADAPIELSGFGSDEIDQIVLGADNEDAEIGELAPDPDARPVSRVGDIFRLGPHRLVCGDATDPAIVEQLMGADIARMIFTDEPFNVAIGGHATGGGHREFVMASGEMTDAQYMEFNRNWIGALLPYLVDGGIFGTFIDWRGLPIVHEAATSLRLSPINLIVWAKTNGGMGSLYRSQHELLPLFKKGTAFHVNNISLGKRGRYRSNVWSYPGASSLGSDARRGLQEHPTVKPTAMLQDALIDLSNRDEIILEPFGGSGSTLIACEKTGRRCRCIELDPLYVDVIIRRYQKVTCQPIVQEVTGQTFDELEESRPTKDSC